MSSITTRLRRRGLRMMTSALASGAVLTFTGGLLTGGTASATSLGKLSCGQTLKSSVKLTSNLDCATYTSGPALTITGNNVTLNLNHHTITGPGGASDTSGVQIGATDKMPANDTVTGGTIKDFDEDVYIDDASNLDLNSLTLDVDTVHEYFGVDVEGNLTGGTISSVTADGAEYGLDLDDTADVAVSDVTVTGDTYGLYLTYAGGDTISHATMTGDEYGFYGEYNTDVTVTDSSASGGGKSAEGFYDDESADSFVGDTANHDEYGFYIYGDAYGATTVESDQADDNATDGFYLYYNYSSYPGNAPTEKVIGNTADGNGGDGFYDYYSPGAKYADNQADDNKKYGMNLEYPTLYTVEGNTVDGNTYSGIYLEENYYGNYYNVKAISDNIAEHDEDYGFYADEGAPGSGNVATQNKPFQCVNVACNGTPTVTKLSPNTGSAGTVVTISGTNLLAPSAVHFNSKTATIDKVLSATKIEVVAPKNLSGTVYVTVSTPGGTSAKTKAARFTY